MCFVTSLVAHRAAAARRAVVRCPAPTGTLGAPWMRTMHAMRGRQHVVAGGHAASVGAAEDILRAGGNAFDAAVAAMAAACAAEPALASLGGGGFLLACPASGRARVYDFFAHTPLARRPLADLDFYPIVVDFGTATQQFHIGRGSIATPGYVAGMFAVQRELGRMPMTELLAPAVRLAKEGVAITDFQAYLFRVIAPVFMASAPCRGIFASATRQGELVGSGEVLRQEALADTLEVLAREGEALFYRGEIAAALERDLRDAGQIGRADLEAYRVERREPLLLALRDARLLTNPPPASGGVLAGFGLSLLAAGVLEGLDPMGADYQLAVADVLQATREARIEAAARDPDAHAGVLDPQLLARYREQILGRASARRGTTHVSIIDAAGNLASVTLSNGEGSGYLVPGSGVMMNNMLGEEDLNPGGFQRWRAGERMTSMMMPSALAWLDGTLVACGSGGSNRIRSALLQVLARLALLRQDPESAVMAPRLHLEDGLLRVEGAYDVQRIAPLLQAWPKHHLWQERSMFFGGAHTVRLGPRGADGCADPRRAGVLRILPA
jgi:gamma-glutamyltranspeptidase/glutathione hydrolase